MVDKGRLNILQGVEVWNKWRKDNPQIEPDLSGVNLGNAILVDTNFSGVNLSYANLSGAILLRAGPQRSRPPRSES